MKNEVFSFLCAVFLGISCLVSCTNVYANTSNVNDIDVLLDEMEQKNASYHPQLEALMKENELDVEYDIKGAYRVKMMEPLFLTILNDNKCFEDTITEVVQWKMPIVTKEGESGLVVFLEEEGKLSYAGKSIGTATRTWEIKVESIREAIRSASEFDGRIYSIQIVHSYLYNTAFVYMDGENNDYLIPYSVYSKETGLENGKVYTLSEVAERFNKCFDENIMIENPSYNGGTPFRTIDKTKMYICTVSGIVFVMGLSGVLYWKVKKRKSY